MKFFQIQPLGLAILMTVLAMGAFGLAVVLPVAFIQWTWNAFVPVHSVLPAIGVWQAVLLYLAATTMLFISGIIRVEVESVD